MAFLLALPLFEIACTLASGAVGAGLVKWFGRNKKYTK